MIELAFVACLASATPQCRSENLLFVDVSLTACMIRGQSELATWTERHPGWEIRKWSCRAQDRTITKA